MAFICRCCSPMDDEKSGMRKKALKVCIPCRRCSSSKCPTMSRNRKNNDFFFLPCRDYDLSR